MPFMFHLQNHAQPALDQIRDPVPKNWSTGPHQPHTLLKTERREQIGGDKPHKFEFADRNSRSNHITTTK
jgi:hypothetical protein